MSRNLQQAKFYELEINQPVIVDDNGVMKDGRVVEIANGPAHMFCSIEVDGLVKQFYFQKIYYTP